MDENKPEKKQKKQVKNPPKKKNQKILDLVQDMIKGKTDEEIALEKKKEKVNIYNFQYKYFNKLFFKIQLFLEMNNAEDQFQINKDGESAHCIYCKKSIKITGQQHVEQHVGGKKHGKKKLMANKGSNVLKGFPTGYKVKANAYLFVLNSNSSFNEFC